MLQVTLIGNLGADAQMKSANGKEFATCRVAHTDRWKDDAGQMHESTIWVDVTINGKPAVFDYLKKGQMIYVTGSCNLRVYSSEKDRCMKAGLTISASRIELLGGRSDDVPSKLVDPKDGKVYDVQKWFLVPGMISQSGEAREVHLRSAQGREFVVNEDGWVQPQKSE